MTLANRGLVLVVAIAASLLAHLSTASDQPLSLQHKHDHLEAPSSESDHLQSDTSHISALQAFHDTPRTRRGAIKGVATTDAQTSYTSYQVNVCAGEVEWSEIECRHRFIVQKLAPLFREAAAGSLNNWMKLNEESRFKLSYRNVILQSGTAVWMYGCRPHQMTNDVDAWLAPSAPASISFNPNNGQSPFTWEVISPDGEEIATWLHPFVLSFTGHEDVASIFDIRYIDDSGAPAWKPLDGTIQGQLARIEYLREGEVLFYLLEYDHVTGKPGGTKDPKLRLRPGNVDYSPWVLYGIGGKKLEFRETFELDMYTPFGALDGDYQWPWVETGKYLLRNPPPDMHVPIIPKHVAIVQKLKLYFDCEVVNNAHYHNEPHRVKHDSNSLEPSTVFFQKNYEKMSQDVADMVCLCAQCKAEEGEGECQSLCALVDIIDAGVAPEIVPDKRQLYEDYQKALLGHGLKALDVPKPVRGELAKGDENTMAERLVRFRDELLVEWKEKTLIQRLKTPGHLDTLIDLFTPQVVPAPPPPLSLALAQEAEQLQEDVEKLIGELIDGVVSSGDDDKGDKNRN